jgi:hypothetical protein
MASRILGIDLGTYSVKVLLAQPGFRQAVPIELIERPLPAARAAGAEGGAAAEPHLIRAARVVADIAREYKLGGDTAYAAASGGELFMHVLELAFRNLRRPDLEKAVGAELEGVLPLDLEDMVYGFESLPADRPSVVAAAPPGASAEVGDDEPTAVQGQRLGAGAGRLGRVAPPTEGLRVLACAMEMERARHMIELLGAHDRAR